MPVFRSFFHYVWRHKRYFIAYLIVAGASRVAESVQPFFLKAITADATNGQFIHAFWIVITLGMVMLAGTLTYAFSMILSDKNVMLSAVDLQMEVMKRIHALDFSYHTEKSSGKLISIMKRGEDAFLTMYDSIIREGYAVVISLVVMLYAFWGVSPKYFWFSLTILFLAFVSSIPLVKSNMVKRKIFIGIDDEVSGVRVDNLMNFDTVKYFAKEFYEQIRLGNLLSKWNDAAQAYFFTFRYFDLIIGNLSNIAMAGTLFLAITDLAQGLIDLPQFVLIASFSAAFFPKMVSTLLTARNMAKKYGDMEQYLNVLNEPVLVKDPQNPSIVNNLSGRIKFDKVGFAYREGQPIFANFSLDVRPGETVALVGLSGSGKTTLVKLLMRMYDLTAGSISIDGVKTSDMSKSYLRGLIGIVPQDPLLFNNTLRYNLGYAKTDASEEELWEALGYAKLDDFVKNLPEGLETRVGERGIKLSGGQRQRLAIARVLLEKAKIIVFDEATSSLDSESEKAVQEAFWSLIKDEGNPRTSIIIAHRLSTVMRADRIIVLREGTITEAGTHKSLLKRSAGLYSRLWALQKGGFLGDTQMT